MMPQIEEEKIPSVVSDDRPTLSCDEKPGGGSLLGAENPGGAET
jgi:hypothetical protein